MKHRPRPESASPREAAAHGAPNTRAAAELDALHIDDGAAHGHGPHHDPSVHTERELFAVTTQRCRGEYP